MIVIVGILFGAAHIFSDDAWSVGKFAQAAASGIIIGWVYFRYGFSSCYSNSLGNKLFYFFLMGMLWLKSIKYPLWMHFSHSLLSMLELILIVTGIISVAVLVLNYAQSKKHALNA